MTHDPYHMRGLVPIFVAISAFCPSRGQSAPQTVFEGKDEVLYLDDWASPSRWRPAECKLTVSEDRLADGRPTLHMHVPVDSHGGQKTHPVGWPRIDLPTRELWERDWTHFDRLEFSVCTEMSRAQPPKTPISLLLYCPVKSRAWRRDLRELKLGQWVKYALPISRMQYVEDVGTVKFYISESSYKHGDQLHFYIGGFRFVRSAECDLVSLTAKTGVVFQGQPSIDVEIDVVGVPKGISRAVPFTIRQGHKTVRHETIPVRRGRYVLTIDIHELKLRPGDYMLTVFSEDAEKAKSVVFRVVADPWQE